MKTMDERITYGVLWKTATDPDEWRVYSAWFTLYAAAKNDADIAMQNPRSVAVKIVERTETFESVAEWERGGDNHDPAAIDQISAD